MRKWRKGLVVGVMAAGVLVPGGAAVAATTLPNTSTPAATATAPTCTGDHQMLRLHDGTGWQHSAGSPGYMHGAGYQHQSGPQDGSGPRANPPVDGTGYQWGRAA